MNFLYAHSVCVSLARILICKKKRIYDSARSQIGLHICVLFFLNQKTVPTHTRSISIPASHMQSPWNSDSLAVTTTLLFSSRNGHCYVLCRETRLLGPVTKLRNSWKYFQEPAPGINQCRPCKYLTQIHHASCASKVGTISHISFDLISIHARVLAREISPRLYRRQHVTHVLWPWPLDEPSKSFSEVGKVT